MTTLSSSMLTRGQATRPSAPPSVPMLWIRRAWCAVTIVVLSLLSIFLTGSSK